MLTSNNSWYLVTCQNFLGTKDRHIIILCVPNCRQRFNCAAIYSCNGILLGIKLNKKCNYFNALKDMMNSSESGMDVTYSCSFNQVNLLRKNSLKLKFFKISVLFIVVMSFKRCCVWGHDDIIIFRFGSWQCVCIWF